MTSWKIVGDRGYEGRRIFFKTKLFLSHHVVRVRVRVYANFKFLFKVASGYDNVFFSFHFLITFFFSFFLPISIYLYFFLINVLTKSIFDGRNLNFVLRYFYSAHFIQLRVHTFRDLIHSFLNLLKIVVALIGITNERYPSLL